ncbi:hypothetical protein QR680_000915 [Steinernema hermaphroditum]|uniref:Uncharacterized protein n=1 Tax=Steinernema hermaphroditum TaxID=289476 RepID=A0AA39GX26_9BILA|nr:hypothetical protein QR680_000915 [Steinernema hermaphroditum]
MCGVVERTLRIIRSLWKRRDAHLGKWRSARDWEELIYRVRGLINWHVMDAFANPHNFVSIDERREFLRTIGEQIEILSSIEATIVGSMGINLRQLRMHNVPALCPSIRQVLGNMRPRSNTI